MRSNFDNHRVSYEPQPSEMITERQVDNYIVVRSNEPEWKDALADRQWGLKNVLPYFENDCVRLSSKPNGELRKARELTSYLDNDPGTSAHLYKNVDELVFDLERYRDEDTALLRQQNVTHEKDEEEIVEGNRDAWNVDIADLKIGNVENVLRRMEKRTVFFNELIFKDEKRIREAPAKEQDAIRTKIEKNKGKRDAARQTRANLLREYFAQGSMH